MAVNVRQELDLAAIHNQLHGEHGGVVRSLLQRGLRVQAAAVRKAPAHTGRLRGSIGLATRPRVVDGTNTFGVVVGTNLEYAKWIIQGTGIYGPLRTPITPKNGTFLVFQATKLDRRRRSDRSGRRVYARSVKGQRPNNFLRDALRSVMR
jgi:hypothetical protein